jgi:electron transfer flavoprotein alpha subunit
MAVLLLADVVEGKLATDAVAKALTAVAPLGPVTVLVAGMGGDGAAAEAATLSGVAKVIFAGDHVYCHGMAEPTAALVQSLAGGFTHVAAPATAFTKSVLPRVAAMLDVMVIPEVVAVHGPDTFDRPIYAGNAIQTVQSADPVKVLTIRTAAFAAAGTQAAAPVETLATAADGALSSWVEDRTAATGRPDLTSAGIVVSGGRGVGSKENFDLIEKLADKLGAAVGASRAAVDSGYAPNDWQVGQTGKVVAPQLYVAVGISGAIQHLAGMKDSKIIVAINKDEEAPIFQIADYGLVGDLFQIVPELIEKA